MDQEGSRIALWGAVLVGLVVFGLIAARMLGAL